MTKKYIYITALFLLPSHLFASSIITDRPDVTEAPQVVPKGRGQLELGIDTTNNLSGITNLGLPLKLRVGLTNSLEIHAESGLVQLQFAPGASFGFAAIDIGGKINFTDKANGSTPAFGLLAAVSIPTFNILSQNNVDAHIKALASWDVGQRLSLSTNVGVNVTFVSGAPTTLPWSLSLGIPVSNKLAIFVEGFGDIAVQAFGASTIGADGGLTYLVDDNLQLDTYINSTMVGGSSIGGGIGISILFD